MISNLEKWIAGEAVQRPPSGASIPGLSPVAKALFLAQWALRENPCLLTVHASKGDARSLVDNLKAFLGSQEDHRVHYLPPYDFDFYRGVLPNPENTTERQVTLFEALNNPTGKIFVTTVGALMQKVVPLEEFIRVTATFKSGDEWDRDALIDLLREAGYQRQPSALDPGVFSVRGGVIDIFSPLYEEPFRLEFFGDLVEEIRFFDPSTQRSSDKQEQVSLVPVTQAILPSRTTRASVAPRLKETMDHLGVPKSQREVLVEKFLEGNFPAENALLFPTISQGSSTLLQYFPKDAILVWDGQEAALATAQEEIWPKWTKSHELFLAQPFALSSINELFVPPDELPKTTEGRPQLKFEPFLSGEGDTPWTLQSQSVSLAGEREQSHHAAPGAAMDSFVKRLKDWMDTGHRVEVFCHTRTHAERIQNLLQHHEVRSEVSPEGSCAALEMPKDDFSKVHFRLGFLTESQAFSSLHLVLLSEEEFFGKKRRASTGKAPADPQKILAGFRDLHVGDFVVHTDFGIGKYLGLKTMNFLEAENDYVLLEYKDGDKLYIPIYRLNVLQKFVGAEGAAPPLDKLGGDRWAKVKSKAKRAIAELAAELIQVQAKRRLLPAPAFGPPAEEYNQFELEFPFDETPDQWKAIEDVMHDLSQPHPMDRLICGDVGYGKTEVAMRAAFRAVLAKKQVAVLVPTTVLAFQHFESFQARMKNSPVRIEMVSRLRSPKEVDETLGRVREGKVDILVGTHRVLSTDVQFKDLGLLIVDEEHRFGVVHKEKIKKMCETVHVLSMSATPIPRTLNMAMTGIKDVSIITTPPPNRLAVRTFVCRNTSEVIAEAISNELARDGQVFFLHNRVESILGVADDLKKLLPKVSFEVTHGQMSGEELETRMLRFYRAEAQVLVTTTIIESGLDIPRANTIIMDDAHHLGLAQLYQLRGRVGRSDKRAYCYLLVPTENLMTAEAKQRLQVIQRYTDLGSGFNIASHDLEIRGAGDLLGKDQSGHLNAVGVDLYFDLLEEAIRELRGEAKKTEVEPEINMKIAASFPTEYLPDISERITLYRRLSSVESDDAVAGIEEEIRDRFGPLPPEVVNLLGLMRLKLYLKRLHVLRMSSGPKKTSLQFASTTPASPEKLVRLIQTDPKRYALTPDQKFVFHVENTDWQSQLAVVQRLSDLLTA